MEYNILIDETTANVVALRAEINTAIDLAARLRAEHRHEFKDENGCDEDGPYSAQIAAYQHVLDMLDWRNASSAKVED